MAGKGGKWSIAAAFLMAAAAGAAVFVIRARDLTHERGDSAILAVLASRAAMATVEDCPDALNLAAEDGICYRIGGDYIGHIAAHPTDGSLAVGIFVDNGDEVADAVKDVKSGKVHDARIAEWHRDTLAAIAKAYAAAPK